VSVQGIILIDIVGAVLLVLIVQLVRKQRMFVGYGIIWLTATGGLMLVVSVPPLLALVTRAVGALFPVSALTLLAFVFIIVVLIFFSVKLTSLSAQQTELIQVLALRDLLTEEKLANSPHRSERGTAGRARPERDRDSTRRNDGGHQL
jgi:hypothetical protein